MGTPLPQDVEFLEHFGVPGMKWGVRRDRRAGALVSLGSGEGGTISKVRSARDVLHPVDLVIGRGIRGGAKRRGARQLTRNAKVRSGQANAIDTIAYYGGTRAMDLIPVREKNVGKDTTAGRSIGKSSGRDLAIVAAAGAYYVTRTILKQKAQDKAADQLR